MLYPAAFPFPNVVKFGAAWPKALQTVIDKAISICYQHLQEWQIGK